MAASYWRCEDCGTLKTNTPARPTVCPVCGSTHIEFDFDEFEKRPDDDVDLTES